VGVHKTYHAEAGEQDERHTCHVNGNVDGVVVVCTILWRGAD
jgi:hypothetical protein